MTVGEFIKQELERQGMKRMTHFLISFIHNLQRPYSKHKFKKWIKKHEGSIVTLNDYAVACNYFNFKDCSDMIKNFGGSEIKHNYLHGTKKLLINESGVYAICPICQKIWYKYEDEWNCHMDVTHDWVNVMTSVRNKHCFYAILDPCQRDIPADEILADFR